MVQSGRPPASMRSPPTRKAAISSIGRCVADSPMRAGRSPPFDAMTWSSRGDHEVERLGRGDEDVRRAAHDRLPLGLRRVAAADGGADDGQVVAHLGGDGADLLQRLLEVAVDVVAERLEGRDVDDLGRVLQRPRLRLPHERVDAGEEGGERLAGAGRRADERVAPAGDVPPARALRVGGRVEAPPAPRVDDGMELDARCDRRRRERHGITSTNMRALTWRSLRLRAARLNPRPRRGLHRAAACT